MTEHLTAEFWSWFNVVMMDELNICRNEEHAEERRNFITATWLLTAPGAGNC